MKRQERLNLFIAALALVVSIVIPTYDKIMAHRDDKKKTSQQLYTAYTLGQRVVQAYIFSTQVTPQSEETKQETMFQLSNAQGLADSLDLRINLREVFQSASPSNTGGPFTNRIFSTVQERLKTVVGERTAAACDLGTWLLWAYVESRISVGDKEKEDVLLQGYPRIRDHINSDLQELKLADEMPEKIVTMKDIEAASSKIKQQLNQTWSY